MSNTQHKRAPKGYSIRQWADGEYHVYDTSGGCIAEELSKREAIAAAWRDHDKRAGVTMEPEAVKRKTEPAA